MKLSLLKMLSVTALVLLFANCWKESYYFYGKVLDGQYIKATIGGVDKVMQSTDGNIFSNIYYFEDEAADNSKIDQLNLVRLSENGKESLQLYINNCQLYDQPFPLNLARDQLSFEGCQPALLQFIRYDTRHEEDIQRGFVDAVIESWDETGYMKGAFSGTLGAGDTAVEVTDGQFYIRVFPGD